MKILLTGSSGRIGKAIAQQIPDNVELIGLDLVPGEKTTQLGNILDEKLVGPLLDDVDAIIHAAALLTPHVGVRPDQDFQLINVEGTQLLLDLALQKGIKRFVFTSTTSVYGCTTRPKKQAVWVTEELPPYPEDIYDKTKLAAEEGCLKASQNGLQTVVLRMSRCFPEPAHLMAFYRLYRGVDARDVGQAHYLAAIRPLPTPFEVFNISGPTPFQNADTEGLLDDPWPIIARYLPKLPAIFEQRHWPKPGSIDRVYCIDKAEEVLGFYPEYGVRELLRY